MEVASKTKEWFLEYVRLNMKMDPALREKLLSKTSHPRVNIFLKNLQREINKAHDICLKKKGVLVSQKTLKEIVYDFTQVFINNMETEAKRLYESDIARLAREAKEQEFKDMQSTLEGKPAGIFEEAGVVIDDKTRKDQEQTQGSAKG